MEFIKKTYTYSSWLIPASTLFLLFAPVNWGHGGPMLFYVIDLLLVIIYFFFGLYLINHSIERNQSLKGLTWAFWMSVSPIGFLVLIYLYYYLVKHI